MIVACFETQYIGYKKVKVGFFYSATYTINNLSSRALQSRKWQLIDKSPWCCSANAAIHCMR